MKNGFPGFPREAVAFFKNLEKNNRREWFQERKPFYDETVKGSMTALIEALTRDMMEFAPNYVTDPAKAIYRIYRDTRFSKDKTPYKTHIAAVFPRRDLGKHSASGFYFSVSHKEVEVAAGMYMPAPEIVLAVRNRLAEHHEEFREIVDAKTLRGLMGDLQGERLTRPPKGFAKDHPAADLLRYKQLLYYKLLDPGIATTPKLYPEIVKRFRALTPFVEFLNKPFGMAAKKAASFLR
ncbi:MAG: DUF2461 domain-containing protein [Bryobacteraceae bacterium]